MKDYELTVVFHPDLEMNIDPALDKVKKTLDAAKANITTEEVDGKKRLAYEIEKQGFGIYYFFELQLPPDALDKISNSFNINDEVIRYLLVKVDPRKAKLNAKKAARAAKAGKSGNESAEAESTNNEEKEA